MYSVMICADLSQMATGMNHEFSTLQKNKPAIICRVAKQVNPQWFSLKLQEKEMISAGNASAIVNNQAWSDEVKVDRLIQAVESKLRFGPRPAQIFQEFVDILQSEPALQDLAQKLQTEYYNRRTPRSEEDEPENGDAEKSRLIDVEEGRRDLHGQTQTEQEWRSHQPHESRCLQSRCENRCILFTCGCGVLVLIAVLILIIVIKGKIDLHLRLNRDTEQEITKSSVLYGIFSGATFHMEQELLLWLSCIIICTPWILTQYTCKQKTKIKSSVAGCCFLLMLGILYFLKDFECFQIGGFLLPASLSFAISSPFVGNLLNMRHLCKNLRLRLVSWLTVMVSFFILMLYVIVDQGIEQDVQESGLQGLQSFPTVPDVLTVGFHPNVSQHIKEDIKRNQHINHQWDRNQQVEQQWDYISGAIELVADVLIVLVLQAIFIICAKTLPIHHTMYGSSWYLSILGVVTTFTLFSVLLLTASLDSASLVAALMLLLTNLVLLTATVKRLPSCDFFLVVWCCDNILRLAQARPNYQISGLPSYIFQVWGFCCEDIKLFKDLVVYYIIIIGIRNLLLEALVLWKTFWL